jgi:hypothetical protein
VARSERQHEHAAALYEASLTLRQELGDKGGIATALYRLGAVARDQGEPGRAGPLYAESLTLFHALGDTSRMALCLEGLAGVATALGRHARAAHLFGAAAALRERSAVVALPLERAAQDRDAVASRTALGRDRFAAEWMRGRLLPLEGALAAARAVVSGGGSDAELQTPSP